MYLVDTQRRAGYETANSRRTVSPRVFTQHHVYVDSSTIHGSTWITTGDGVDLVYLLGRSRFASDVFLDGGQGKHDTLRIDRTVAFDAVLAVWGFEAHEFPWA